MGKEKKKVWHSWGEGLVTKRSSKGDTAVWEICYFWKGELSWKGKKRKGAIAPKGGKNTAG